MSLTIETVGAVVAFSLTLLVATYLIGDNPFYRIAIHMFLGAAAAYATIVALQSVLIPQLLALYGAFSAQQWMTLGILAVPWFFAILLFLRTSKSMAPIGNLAIALMVGVGAALAIGGGLMGTLIPQVQASWGDAQSSPDIAQSLLLWCPGVTATSLVLLYFLYIGRKTPGGRGERHPLTRPLEFTGRFFLSFALAALYVGALAAYFAIFIERVDFIRQSVGRLLSFFGINLG
jgi:hypothetical protein